MPLNPCLTRITTAELEQAQELVVLLGGGLVNRDLPLCKEPIFWMGPRVEISGDYLKKHIPGMFDLWNDDVGEIGFENTCLISKDQLLSFITDVRADQVEKFSGPRYEYVFSDLDKLESLLIDFDNDQYKLLIMFL